MTDKRDGVLVPITTTAAEEKVHSLLVARAYATAYCSMLAEEAGVAATPVIAKISATVSPVAPPPVTVPPPRHQHADTLAETVTTATT